MNVSLTVGKVDAGVAVLLTEDKRLVSPYTLLHLNKDLPHRVNPNTPVSHEKQH